MKSINLILIYFGTFIGLFLLFSAIGLLWNESYSSIISDHTWFIIYTIFFGWWLAIFPTREYYAAHEDYLNEVF